MAAYKLALQNAKAGGGVANVKPYVSFKMKPDEALKILNIEKNNLSNKSIGEQYDKFYKLNDPANGGSFYLRSKVFRAKEALEREVAQAGREPRTGGRNKVS